MNTIKINGQKIESRLQRSIRVNRFNSLLNHSEVKGSTINDFELPFSPINDAIMGYYRHSSVGRPTKNFYAEVNSNGYILEKGYLDIIDVTNEDYIVAFTQRLSEFFGIYQNELINKMPMGGQPIGTPSETTNFLVDKFYFPTILNEAFYGTNFQGNWYGKMNEWSNGDLNINARCPVFFVRWIFERIGELCNCEFKGTFFESEAGMKAVYINTFSLDDATDIVYANHMPEMTVVELIFSLRKLFNLALNIDVNKRVMYLDIADDLMKKPTKLNWTDKIVPNNAKRPELNTKLQLDWELDGNDALMKGLPLPVGMEKYSNMADDGNVYEIKTKLSPIAMVNGLATMVVVGNSNRFQQGAVKFGNRIGLFGGDTIVSSSIADLDLSWSGINGLKNKFWNGFEKFKSNTSYKKSLANLTALDLHEINWHNNRNAEHSVYIKGKNYFIMGVSFLWPLNGLAELDLWEKN